MSTKRAFWGDLRLWYYGKGYVESVKRGTRQTHQGIDRKEVLYVGASPNFEAEVEVETFFAPTTSYDQASFRAHVAAMIDALTERAAQADPGHPLVWVTNADESVELASGATAPYATSSPHGLVVGDRVLIRALGVGDYLYAAVATTPTSSSFTVTPLETGAAYAPAAGHDVHRVERAWPGVFFDSMTPLPVSSGSMPGDYYAPTAAFRFFGSRTSVYTRTSVDLDA